MLVINALKQIEKGSLKQENSKKQTEAILSQLRENSLKERATIIAISLLALTGFLVTQSIWTYAAVSAFSSLIFWFKSR
jgi:energy-converting hydrogenase Eha subunit H